MPISIRVKASAGVHDVVGQGTVTLGRAANNQVMLDAPEVSRFHATIEESGAGLVFTDLGSGNGSRVAGREAEPRVPVSIAPGDLIEIGPFSITAQRDSTIAPGPPIQRTVVGLSGATAMLVIHPSIIVTTPRGTSSHLLDRAELTLGRAAENDIVVPEEVVSRRHLVFHRKGATFEVSDFGTTNGIRVAGERVSSRILAEGDVLDIAGTVSIRFTQGAAAPEAAQAGQVVSLQPGKEMTIGRSPDCGLVLDHPAVSALHARISQADGHSVIEDLGSSNGTFVNGDRLLPGRQHALAPGDVVRAGPVKLVFSPGQLHARDESREIALTATHLNQRLPSGLNLLQDLSVAIHPHEFVAVVGVSGAGKSTLLGALSGLRPASDGDVLVNGTSLYRNFQSYRTTLGYVPQDDILHKELPVYRALEYSAELRLPDDTRAEERQGRVDSVIETLGLQQRKETPVGRLSGGQRKRVSIGAELITRPGLFFLDEATSGLDPGTEGQLMRLLRRLADDGHTIVLITHATKNVMLCDQVLFLARGGYLAYYGPPDKALTYFGVQDFDGIYELLEDSGQTPEEWAQRYVQSPLHKEFVEGRLRAQNIDVAATVSAPSAAKPAKAARSSSWPRQLKVLSVRYLDIIRRDRVMVALLFLIAPLVGALDFLMWPRDVLSFQNGDGAKAMTMLFLAALFPFLIGAMTFVREIVKESAIYARERAVSLRIWPYLISKIGVGSLFALYHALALTAIQVIAVSFPGMDAMQLFKIYVTITLAVTSGVLWALLISAITNREEQAMLLAIGVIVLQVVFSGGLLPMSDLGPLGTVLGAITSTNWAFQALTTSAGLSTSGCEGDFSACRLPGFGGYTNQTERQLGFDGVDTAFGGTFGTEVLTAWLAMVAIIVVLSGVLFFLQKRKDTL